MVRGRFRGGWRRLTIDDFGEDLYRQLVHEVCDTAASGADGGRERSGAQSAACHASTGKKTPLAGDLQWFVTWLRTASDFRSRN